jgi:N-hydroxyarylamine O-acetyltransferase
VISDDLVRRVRARLDLGSVSIDEEGMRRVYAAWCTHVPFDNIQKRVWLAERRGPMPGDDAARFFEDFLAHGTGGTCWGSSGALHALLRALGFDARRAAGTMMLDTPDPSRRLNHGTVIVAFDNARARWLLDTHVLTVAPLRLPEGDAITSVDGVAAVRAQRSEEFGGIRVRFDPNNGRVPEMSCLLERDEVDDAFCTERHLASETSGPFNAGAYVRRHHRGALVFVGLGMRRDRDRADVRVIILNDRSSRDDALRNLGFSAEIVSRLPDDHPPG